MIRTIERKIHKKRTNCVLVALEAVYLRLGANVPHAHRRVTTTGEEDIKRRMDGTAPHAAQVTVVLAHNLVHFHVPALDLLIIAHRKDVRVPVAHHEAAHSRNVSRECQFEGTACEIPDLYRAIC